MKNALCKQDGNAVQKIVIGHKIFYVVDNKITSYGSYPTTANPETFSGDIVVDENIDTFVYMVNSEWPHGKVMFISGWELAVEQYVTVKRSHDLEYVDIGIIKDGMHIIVDSYKEQ